MKKSIILMIPVLIIILTGCNKRLSIVDVSDKAQKQQSATENLDSNKPTQVEEKTKQANIVSRIFNNATLDLSNTGLTQVSQDVFKKTNLTELDVSNNNLTGALPGEIRHLQKLETLDMSNNQMTGIPAEVGQLKNLRILNLSNNQFTGLPYELGNLDNLEILDLSGNDYSTLDLDIIRKSLSDDVNIIL